MDFDDDSCECIEEDVLFCVFDQFRAFWREIYIFIDTNNSRKESFWHRIIETVESSTSLEKLNNVTVDEIVELNKKINIHIIYLLKGDN